MVELPTFTTERLILRPRALGDLDALLAMDGEPDVMWFIGDGSLPDPENHRAELIERIATDFGFMLGYWSVVTRVAPDAFLGWVCLVPLPGHDMVEIGWRFRSAAWGQGYATEAARVLIPHGFETAGLGEIVAVVKPQNSRSLRIVEKLGLAPSGTCIAYGEELLLFRLRRPTGS